MMIERDALAARGARHRIAARIKGAPMTRSPPTRRIILLGIFLGSVSLRPVQPAERVPLDPERRPEGGEADQPAPPALRRELPDREPRAEAGCPPPPFAAAREREIAGEVFSRFPGLDGERVVKFLQDTFAPQMRRFRELDGERREEAVDVRTRLVREYLELQDVKRRRPEAFEQHLQFRRLEKEAEAPAAAVRRMAAAEASEARMALRQTLERAFDLKQQMSQGDIAHLEGERERLRRTVETRARHRDAIVDRRMKELLAEREVTAW